MERDTRAHTDTLVGEHTHTHSCVHVFDYQMWRREWSHYSCVRLQMPVRRMCVRTSARKLHADMNKPSNIAMYTCGGATLYKIVHAQWCAHTPATAHLIGITAPIVYGRDCDGGHTPSARARVCLCVRTLIVCDRVRAPSTRPRETCVSHTSIWRRGTHNMTSARKHYIQIKRRHARGSGRKVHVSMRARASRKFRLCRRSDGN